MAEPQRIESHEAVIGVDAGHRVVSWNEGAGQLLGHSAREAKGRPFGELLVVRDAFGNDFCPRGCWLHEMAQQSEPISGFAIEVERPEGETLRFWVHSHLEETNGRRAGYRLELRLRQCRRWMDEQRVSNHIEDGRTPPAGEGSPRLTVRQRQVLSFAADGCRAPEIANRLHLSTSTVQKHLQRALRSLDTHHLPAAVARALRQGLI